MGDFLRLPACQSLSLWERWHCDAMTERASPAGKSRRRSDGQALCQSDTIAVSELFVSGLALSVSSLCSSPAPPEGEPLACRSGSPSYNLSVSLRSTAPLVGEPLAKRRSFPLCQGLPSVGATATTAASGGNREELLGPRPAGCERQRSRRWEPQPGQWQRVSRDGEVELLSQRESLCLRALREFVENARVKREEFVKVIKMRRRY